jgi:hypothetical protein
MKGSFLNKLSMASLAILLIAGGLFLGNPKAEARSAIYTVERASDLGTGVTGFGVNFYNTGGNANMYNINSVDAFMGFVPTGDGTQSGFFNLKSQVPNTNLCLAPVGLYNGAALKLFTCGNSTRWKSEETINGALPPVRLKYVGTNTSPTNWCLNSPNISQYNGGGVNVYPCNASPSGDIEQAWRLMQR